MHEHQHPSRLFHGTPHEIHTSERPFLDPRLAGGYDDGDPEEGHVFATPDMLMASIFAFKDSDCINISRTEDELVVVYAEKPPRPDAKGLVYEVPPEGFRQTMLHGYPSGKWAMVESDMSLLTDNNGEQVPGIPLTDPVRRVMIRDLIEQDQLRICTLTGEVDADTYADALRDATKQGSVTVFIREAIERGWLHDITDSFFDDTVEAVQV